MSGLHVFLNQGLLTSRLIVSDFYLRLLSLILLFFLSVIIYNRLTQTQTIIQLWRLLLLVIFNNNDYNK